MSMEGPPKQKQSDDTKIEREPTKKEKIIALAIELSENREGFPFFGIDPESYTKLKTDIAGDEGRSDYDISSPTIDELIERFKNEGMRVTLGNNPEVGNVFILPTKSNDIQNDNILPKHLQISEGMDEKLKELILLSRS
jgi:hypothetical protein